MRLLHLLALGLCTLVAPAASPPVGNTTNLYGVYVMGRGTQLVFWRGAQEEFSGYRLYWWTLGGTTNNVDLPKPTQRVMLCGLAGGNQAVTYIMATVLNGPLESVPSNTVAVPPEP